MKTTYKRFEMIGDKSIYPKNTPRFGFNSLQDRHKNMNTEVNSISICLHKGFPQ